MTIKPIPTQYAGIKFRSKLEAGYAATFDNLGMPWQYEPEGYELSDGSWYLPDFYLPSARAWLEVKGDHMQRVSKVEQFAADLWEQAGQPDIDNPNAPMVIMARSPEWWGSEFDRAVNMRTPQNRRHDSPRWLGIRGLGKKYSVGLAECAYCEKKTFIAYWSKLCRANGCVYEDGLDWMDSVHSHYETEFIHVQAGRRVS